MTDKHTQAHAAHSNMEKDPDQWVTGDEPMTGAQRSYLKTLCEEAKEVFNDKLTKAEASKRIDQLQEITGRGTDRQNATREGLASPDPTANPASLGTGDTLPKKGATTAS